MTREELIAALAPSRLPQDMPGIGLREGLALMALGIMAGLLLALILRPLMRVRASRRARIHATRGLPPQERLLAIARILGHLPAPLRPPAYGAAPSPGDDEIERIASRGRRAR